MATLSSSTFQSVIERIFLLRRRFAAHATFDIVRVIHPTVRTLLSEPGEGHVEDDAWLNRTELTPAAVIELLGESGFTGNRGGVFALFLDRRCGLIDWSRVGQVEDFASSSMLDAILRSSIERHAAGLILASNDPDGGHLRRARARNFTARLAQKAEAIDLCVLDHFIFTSRGWQQMSKITEALK